MKARAGKRRLPLFKRWTVFAPISFMLLGLLAACAGYTSGATNVTATSATLNALVSCYNWSPCSYYFQWGTNQAYQYSQPVQGPYTQLATNFPVSYDTGNTLQPNTTYQYQVCGWGDGVTTPTCVGSDGGTGTYSTFTTLSNASLTFTANPATVIAGSTSTLSWTADQYETQCVASGAWSGTYGITGTYTTPALAVGNYNYTLTCSGGGGISKNITVTAITPPTAPPSPSPVPAQTPNTTNGSSTSTSDPATPPCVIAGQTFVYPTGSTPATPPPGYPTTNTTPCPRNTTTFSVAPSPVLLSYNEHFTFTVPKQVQDTLPDVSHLVSNPSKTIPQNPNYPAEAPNGPMTWTPNKVTIYFESSTSASPTCGSATAPVGNCETLTYTDLSAGPLCTSVTINAKAYYKCTVSYVYSKTGSYHPQLAVSWDTVMPYSLSIYQENRIPYQTMDCLPDPVATPNYYPTNKQGSSPYTPNNDAADPNYSPQCTDGTYPSETHHTWPLDNAATNQDWLDSYVPQSAWYPYQPKPTANHWTAGHLDINWRNTYALCQQCDSTGPDADGYCFNGWHTAVNEPGSSRPIEHVWDNGGYYDNWSNQNTDVNGSQFGCLGALLPNQNVWGPAGNNPGFYWFGGAGFKNPAHGYRGEACPSPCGDHDDYTGGQTRFYNSIVADGALQVVVSGGNHPVEYWSQPPVSGYQNGWFDDYPVLVTNTWVWPNGATPTQWDAFTAHYLHATATNRTPFTPDPNLTQTSGILQCANPTDLNDPQDWVGGSVGGTLKPECQPNYDKRTWQSFYTNDKPYASVQPDQGHTVTNDVETPTPFENDNYQIAYPSVYSQYPRNPQTFVSGWVSGNAYFPRASNCNPTTPPRDPDGQDYGARDNYSGSLSGAPGAAPDQNDPGPFGAQWLISSDILYTANPDKGPVNNQWPCGADIPWNSAGNPQKFTGWGLTPARWETAEQIVNLVNIPVWANLDRQSPFTYEKCCFPYTPTYKQLLSDPVSLQADQELWPDSYTLTVVVTQEQPVQG